MTAAVSLPVLRRRLAAAHQLLVRPQQPQPQLLPVTITDVQSPERPAAPIQNAGHSVVRMIPPQELKLDPARFQFRLSPSADGTTGRLKGCSTFRLELCGALMGWIDPQAPATGVWLIDGHHRRALALADHAPLVPVLLVQAADAKAARIWGAASNIANGHAEAPELCRLLRDMDLTPGQLALQFNVHRQCRPLLDAAQLLVLAPELFTRTAIGELPLAHALALCGTADHALQHRINQMAERRRWSPGQIQEAVALAGLAPAAAQPETLCLPGLEQALAAANPGVDLDAVLAIRSAIRLQLRIAERALKVATCRRHATVLESSGAAVVDREAAAAARAETMTTAGVFAQLAGTSGPLAGLIKELAALVSDEMPAAAVVEQNLSRIHAVLSAELS